MSTNSLSLLDQAELLQLSLNASAANDAGTAIAYLKEAVSRPDATATAHYILGAEYAQSRMYERAAGEMEAALALDPTLSIARLQLGLLWLTGGAAAQAATVLGPLSELGEADPLRLFGRGLCLLIENQLADAAACLEKGIAMNATNPALNGDMQKIVDELATLQAAGTAPSAPLTDDSVEDDDELARRRMLSAYTGNTSH